MRNNKDRSFGKVEIQRNSAICEVKRKNDAEIIICFRKFVQVLKITKLRFKAMPALTAMTIDYD